MSRLRKSLIVAGVLLLLVVTAGVVFVLTFDANRYRGVILAQLRQAVHRPVEAEQLELQIYPLRLRLNQVRVQEDPSFAAGEFLRARAVQFDLSLWSLLRGQPEVLGLELVEPTLHLRQNAAGQWNVATLAGAPAPGAAVAAPAALPVTHWTLEGGTLIIERPGESPLTLSGVDLSIADLSTVRRFPFQVAVSFPGESRVSAQGEIGPLNLETLSRTPVTAAVKLETFRPAVVASLVRVPAVLAQLGPLDGTLDLDTKVDQGTLAGQLALPATPAGEELSADFKAAFPADFSRLDLSSFRVETTGATLSASGRVPLAAGSGFELALSTSDAKLTALRHLAARFGLPVPASLPAATGQLTAALKVAGTPDSWTLAGTATLHQLSLLLEGSKQPLTVAALDLTLSPDRITAAPFQVSPEPGLTLTASGSISDYRRAPQLEARIAGDETPLAPLLALATRLGHNPLPPNQQLTGRVQPDLTLSGPLDHPEQLRYQGTLALRDLLLTTPDLPEPVHAAALRVMLDPRHIAAEPFTAQVGRVLQARVSFRLDDYQTKPFVDARVTTEAADVTALLGLVRALGVDPLPQGSASGQVSADLTLKGAVGKGAPTPAVSGRVRLSGATVQPAGLTAPLRLEQATLDFGADRLTVSDLRAQAAGAHLEGSLRLQDFSNPVAQFDLRGDALDLDALEALFATTPARTSSLPRLSLSVVYAKEKEDDWFSRLRARGQVRLDSVRRGTLTLAPLSAPVALNKQVLTSDPVDFGLYGGGGRGRLVADLRGTEPAVTFSGLLRNVDANQLLSANTDSKNRLYGKVGGKVDLSFSGDAWPAIRQSARGKGELSLVDGRLSQLSLNRELVLLGSLTGLSTDRGDTPIEDMTTTFTVGDGWVRTNDLILRTPDLAMSAVGGFSLTDELAFEATAVFTQEASRRMTSRSVLGALTGGVLTDDQGRVVVPFLVRGTFAQPKLTLDTKRLLDMRLNRGRGGTGGSSWGDVLDRLLKQKVPPR